MKLVRIFVGDNEDDGGLYAIKLPEYTQDEYRRFLNLFTDDTFLLKFFKEHHGDLNSGFYGEISIDDSIERTLDEIQDIQQKIKSAVIAGIENLGSNLEQIFRPLDDREYEIKVLQITKLKSSIRKIKNPWVRVYAIRIAKNSFIIIGGTIKLTKNLAERTHTDDMEKQAKRVLGFLKNLGINSVDDIIYYYESE